MKKSSSASPSELAAMTGLTVRWLRELANRHEIPKPTKGGKYPMPATVHALLKHYQTAARAAKLDPLKLVRKELLEDRLKRSREKLLPLTDAIAETGRLISECKQRILSLPDHIQVRIGCNDEDREIIRGMVREALDDLHNKWTD